MLKEIKLFTPLHQATTRDYTARVLDNKNEAVTEAEKFDYNYWDGDRRYGYGGYKYDGRWKIIAQKLIQMYSLNKSSYILDVGCGKAHLLFEIKKIIPQISITGIDISKYAINNAKEEIRKYLKVSNCIKLDFKDRSFDLVFSFNVLHNLSIEYLFSAIKEINRVGKTNKLIVLESYTNINQKNNLLNWQLTCKSFYNKKEWIWIYNFLNYDGDYEFIYFD